MASVAALAVLALVFCPSFVSAEEQIVGRWLEEPDEAQRRSTQEMAQKIGLVMAPKTLEFFGDGTGVLSLTYRERGAKEDSRPRHQLRWYLSDGRRLKLADQWTGGVSLYDVQFRGDTMELTVTGGDSFELAAGHYRRQP